MHVLSGSQNGETSPYAWPTIANSPGKVPLKVQWGPSCPKCVAAWNEVASDGKWDGLVYRYPGSWKSYVVTGIVDFMAPRGMADSVVVDACTRIAVWHGKDLRVEIRRVAPVRDVVRIGRSGQPNGEYMVFEPLGECKASIGVTETKNYCHLDVSVASTTNTIDNLDIVVAVRGKNASETARTILGTMLFPMPE